MCPACFEQNIDKKVNRCINQGIINTFYKLNTNYLMGRKDFFWKAKLVLAVNVILSVAAAVVFNFNAAELGFLIGAAMTTSLCTHPDKAFGICLLVQLVLLAAIALGAGVWFVMPAFFLLFPALLYLAKDADRISLLVTYFIGLLFPLVAIAAALGIEKAVCWL